MPTQQYRNSAGVRLPGVTTVIGGNLGWSKDGLIHWAYKLGQEGKDLKQAREGAADIGSIAHDLVESHLLEDGRHDAILAAAPEAMRRPALEAYGAFERWWKQTRGVVIATELWGVNEEYQTGWCLDALKLTDDGAIDLYDWKSSNGTYPDMLIQIATYTEFAERDLTVWLAEVLGRPVRFGEIHLCRFDKTYGNFTHHSWRRDTLAVGFSAFTWLRALHGVRRQLEQLAK